MSPTANHTEGQQNADMGALLAAVSSDEQQRFGTGWRVTGSDSYDFVKSLDDASRREVLLGIFLARQQRLRTEPFTGTSFVVLDILGALITHFGRTSLEWTAAQVSEVLSTVAVLPFDSHRTIDDFRFAVGIAEQLTRRQAMDERCRAELCRVRDIVVGQADSADTGSATAINSLRVRLQALVPDANDGLGGVAISAADPFGRRSFDLLRPLAGRPDLASTLTMLAKPNHSASWRAEVVRRHEDAPLVRDVARLLIHALGDIDVSDAWQLAPSSIGLIKGAAAVLAEVGDSTDAKRLERAAVNSAPLAQAFYSAGASPRSCIAALGALRDPDAQAALVRLQTRFRSGDLKKRVAAALDVVATRSGMSSGELVERRVGDEGLDTAHSLALGTTAMAVEIRVTGTGVVTNWTVDGRLVGKAPADAKTEFPALVAEVRTAAKRLTTAFAAQRSRIEGLFAEGRSWAPSDWLVLYADHRLIGPIVAGLLWQGEIDAGWTTFLGGNAVPKGASSIRLWHPLHAAHGEIEFWRDEIVRLGLRQPFKQAFRENYVLTPAEREARQVSARFERHMVRTDQLYALLKGRGWHAKWLGTFEGGRQTTQRQVLAEGRYRVGFDLDLADQLGFDDCALTGAVHFDRLLGKSWRSVDLADIPPLVFSEAMRDVDLFVSVATVANDPTWRERRIRAQTDRDVFDTRANAELTSAGEIRRAAIERILPHLKISEHCALDERSLRVRGSHSEYAIHLGTANVMMLPLNQYLCIVQGSPGATRGVFLPFEGDDLLSLILSKAVLLAADHKIKDESILRQIRWTSLPDLAADA
jgi:hypothetical protein